MAISNYGELKTSVANWLDRDDLTDRIPEFIALCESMIIRSLRIRGMETLDTSITTVAGQRNYDLPSGYLQMKEFHLDMSPIRTLSYLTPEMMFRVWAGSTSGTPNAYTIIKEQFYLGPAPNSAGTAMNILYYKQLDALSDSTATNWVITNAPHLYLYGSLLQAEPFLMNDSRVPLWERAVRQSLADIQEQDNKDRHSGSEMRVMNTGGYF
jgi:hypothetical protein